MKLGVLTVPLQEQSAEDAFRYLSGLGVETVELGAGCYTNGNHLQREAILADPKKAEALKALLKKYDLRVL